MNLEFWESLNYGKKWIHEEKNLNEWCKKSRQNKTTWTTMCENCMKHEKSKAKHDVSADTCANFRFESFSGPWDEAENKWRNKWMNKICVQEMTYNYLWNSTDLLSCKIKCTVSVNSETVCVCVWSTSFLAVGRQEMVLHPPLGNTHYFTHIRTCLIFYVPLLQTFTSYNFRFNSCHVHTLAWNSACPVWAAWTISFCKRRTFNSLLNPLLKS